MARPLRAEINLAALRHNYQLALGSSPDGTAVAVVKANAYGHGAVEVASALADLAPAFAVACIEEADELVAAGIRQPVLLLEGFFTADELPRIVRHGYETVLHAAWQLEQLEVFLAEGQVAAAALNIWLKVDTGMHRLGFAPEETAAVYRRLQALPAVGKVTLTTHFARADELSSDATTMQLQKLQALQHELGCAVSVANSPAILGWPQAQQGWLRPGIMLYGASPLGAEHLQGARLQPVMSLKSALISVRELPAGEAVHLTPSGTHVMLMNLREPLAEGGHVPVTLHGHTADGSAVEHTVDVPVHGIAAGGAGHGHDAAAHEH